MSDHWSGSFNRLIAARSRYEAFRLRAATWQARTRDFVSLERAREVVAVERRLMAKVERESFRLYEMPPAIRTMTSKGKFKNEG